MKRIPLPNGVVGRPALGHLPERYCGKNLTRQTTQAAKALVDNHDDSCPIMITSPLVSVIIPAYNASRFIRKTLDSVLAQSYQNIEVVVVDDGSIDDTARIVQSICNEDGRVLLYRQSNKGVAAARNLAIAKSRGQYLAPIDADDVWLPSKVGDQVKRALRSGPEVGLVYSWYVRINEYGSYIGPGKPVNIEGFVHTALVFRNFVGNGSVPLIKKACLDAVGGYNSSLRDRDAEGCEG